MSSRWIRSSMSCSNSSSSDLGAARRGELLLDLEQLVAHQLEQRSRDRRAARDSPRSSWRPRSARRRSCRAPAPVRRCRRRSRMARGLRLGQPVGAVIGEPRAPGSSISCDQRRDVGRPASRGPSAARAPSPGRARCGSARSPRRCWRRRRRGRPGCGRGRAPCAARTSVRRVMTSSRKRDEGLEHLLAGSSARGRPPFSASMLTPKLVCSGVKR